MAWAVDNLDDENGNFARTLESFDADITRLVYANLVRRRTLGVAAVGPDGSIELRNGTVYLIFLVMAIVATYLIHATSSNEVFL